MPILTNLERIQLYIETWRKSLNLDPSYLSSAEYQDTISLAKSIYKRVEPLCETFLNVVKGLDDGSTLGIADYDKAMNFPRRFLKLPSITSLPQSQRVMLEATLEEAFLLGLLFHLISWTFPTRKQLDRVNTDTLLQLWALEALVADTKMKQYNKELSKIPELCFESFYETQIQPKLREMLKMGFWTRSKCRSFFNNLFFAGARLGMHWDLCTKEQV